MNRPGTIEFHRPARVHPAPVDRDAVKIASPPTVPEPIGNAVWQVLAPVLGSVGMIGFAVVLGEPRYMIMAGVLAGAMLASGIISRIVQVRGERKRRARAETRYRSHLVEARSRLDRAASVQRSVAERTDPTPTELLDIAHSRTRVWERRLHHRDFLSVRLGTGSVESLVYPQVDLGTDPMTELEPELLAAAQAIEGATGILEGLPIVVDLDRTGCLAIVGDRPTGRRLARSLIAQFAVLRSPADLGIIAIAPQPDRGHWEWVKWLPHGRASQTNVDDAHTLLTTSLDEFDVVLEQLTEPRLQAIEQERSTLTVREEVRFRQAVVLVDGYTPTSDIGRLDRLDTALDRAREIGILAVVLVDHPDDVPTHAGATVNVGHDGTLTFAQTRHEGLRIGDVRPDGADLDLCESMARALAPLRVRTNATPTTLDSAGLLELLDEDSASFDTKRLWEPSGAPLQTPIGLGPDAEPLMLDIREAALGGMGPHGILIGATGSGKSELLRTLVLGLASTNPPEELSFVLADFKGGATFAGLESLPHVAGTITNIEADPTLIDRMQDALFGELERRQRFLRAVGFDRADEYREHRSSTSGGLEPLPALMVVVDEFGELLANRPEFVELFTTIGRTGRSLGVHLLLSSQRLDEGRIRKVESHLRYRICLRTFSPEESTAVIGSRASFDLPPIPGIGHLSVDSQMTQFKAGLVNRPIRSNVTPDVANTPTARRFEFGGLGVSIGTARQGSPSVASDGPTRPSTEMQFLLERLDEPERTARPVWLEPLPETLPFTSDGQHEWLTAVIGTTDVAREQLQRPATLDFSGTSGNLAIIGGPRSGKSTALSTLVTSLSVTHRPDALAIYGIDLGGGLLHQLEGLPHVGSVFGRSHREEIPRLIRQMHSLIQHRVELFRTHGLISATDFHAARRDGTIESAWGEVFLIIDNWGLFTQEFGIDLADVVQEIVSGGLHYGIHVVLSASRWQDIRMSLRDNIGGRFELHLSDPIESEIDRHASRQLGAAIPGRGIDATGALTQVMVPLDDLDSIADAWTGITGAPPIRMLPSLVREADVSAIGPGVLGIEERALAGWAPDLFASNPHLVILGDSEAGKTTALRGILRGLQSGACGRDIEVAVIDYRRQLVSEVDQAHRFGHACTQEEATALAARISAELAHRKPTESSEAADLVVVIDDYDLVASSTSNPIGGLVDAVARGRDLRFHLVIARRVSGLSRSSFEPVFQRIRESGAPMLVMSGDPDEGPVTGSVKASELPPGRGLYVDRSRSTLVQVANFAPRASVHRIKERSA